jgi:hypothetical protein
MEKQDLTQIIIRIEKLEKAVFDSGEAKKKSKLSTHSKDIDFSLNARTFIKRYAIDKSGPKKFTLLLAFLAKGEIGKNMELSEIRKYWNRSKAKNLLRKFNMFYPNDAKTRGWVDSKKYGSYCLRDEWENVL